MHMKKILLLLGALLASITSSAQLVFVDAEDNELADGATITMSETSYNDFEELQVGLEGISIKNTSEKGTKFNMDFNVTQITYGNFSCCFGGKCQNTSKTGVLSLTDCVSKANTVTPIEFTEWLITEGQYGTCKVTITLSTGRSLHVVFNYADPSAVEKISTNKKVAGYYEITGKPQTKLQKGINLVRYADGSVKKIIR